MKIIITLIKAIGSIFLFIIPVIMLYWILDTINLSPLQFITTILETLLKPLLGFIKAFTGDKSFALGDLTVNLVPLFLCVVCFVIYLAFLLVAHIISMFDSSLHFVSAKTKIAYTQKQHDENKKKEEKRLLEKNMCYVVINFKQQTTSSAYLTSSGYSKEDISEQFLNLVQKYEFHDARKIETSKEEQTVLLFQEVVPSVNYALNLLENAVKLNIQLDKAGVKLIVNVGLFCTEKNEPIEQASKVSVKVSHLAAPGEAACSKEVKEIYEQLNPNNFVEFVSKGMYDINGEIEIFSMKKLY